MEATIPAEKVGLLLKIGFFMFLVFAGVLIFGFVLNTVAGYLIGSVVGVFIAALIANITSMRIFERRSLVDIGLRLNTPSLRQLGLGFAIGAAAACLVIGLPMIAGFAHFEATPSQPGSFVSALFVTAILICGAVGEEMMFRGYAFQILSAGAGRILAVLVSSALFGWAHSGNQNASTLGLINTVGFGIVLSYAVLRCGHLWMAIGIHLGWNWILPLAGVNLSGFTMGVTGYAVRWSVGELWSGGDYGPEASLLTSVILVGIFAYLHFAPVRTQHAVLLEGRAQEG